MFVSKPYKDVHGSVDPRIMVVKSNSDHLDLLESIFFQEAVLDWLSIPIEKLDASPLPLLI